MTERPSPANDLASVQQVLQPLQRSAEQTAPPTAFILQPGAIWETTTTNKNTSQSSSQDNITEMNVSNSTEILEVF